MKLEVSQVMKNLLRTLFVAFPAIVNAQLITPGAGAILQQNQPAMSPAPSSNGTEVTIERGNAAELPGSAPFIVRTLQISGNTLFDTPTLYALVVDAEGKSLNLTQLGELSSRITEYYQRRSYPLARAIIPAQTIANGDVRIEVIEARYDQILLDNRSRLNDSLVQATLSTLQGGQFISQTELDRVLLLLSDIPGVLVDATLKPGRGVGTSDLTVKTSSSEIVTGNLVLDNSGNFYTGRARIGGSVSVINPLHHGDVLSFTGLSSGSGMNYGRITYESLLNGLGTRLGGSYATLRYVLGETLVALKAHGTAEVRGFWVKHPMKRNREVNVSGQIQYDNKQLKDRVDTTGIYTDRRLDNLTLSFTGDAQLFGGINSWNFSWTSGRVGFDAGAAQLSDAATARTQGKFSKWNANLIRLQSLSPKSALYLAFSGQWANTNLDSAEKMSVSGPAMVRAYDTGALSGDSGYFGTAELRYNLVSDLSGQWQAVAFVDTAGITVNKNVWVAGSNSATTSGGGVGLNWAGMNQWRAKAHIAKRIGTVPTITASNGSTRAWVEISKGF